MTGSTGFDPAVHGFRFRNRFPGGAVVDALLRMDRMDELLGFEVPRAAGLPAPIRDASFWGTFGLCGGMSWAALDRFHSGISMSAAERPPVPASASFDELVIRQADSMDGRRMLERCLEYQVIPRSAPWWFPFLRTLASEMRSREWPRLEAALEAGTPESLCLVRVRGVASPALHHQVVATGFRSTGSEIRVSVYDPNHPGSTPEIRLRKPDRFRPLSISQSSGEELFGFFVQPWSPPGG